MFFEINELVAFIIGTTFFVWVSRHSLFKPLSHGFYRFFAWEALLALMLLHYSVWNLDPFAPHQLASWFLMTTSLFLVIHAVSLLKKYGHSSDERDDKELLAFEKTSVLVTTGAYHYIRHPMYASLLFLSWGAYLKEYGSRSFGIHKMN